MSETLPRWNLAGIYPGLESQELYDDLQELQAQLERLESYFADRLEPATAEMEIEKLASLVGKGLEGLNATSELAGTLESYLTALCYADSFDEPAKRARSEFDLTALRLRRLVLRFSTWIGRMAPLLPSILALEPQVCAHTFFLEETVRQSSFMMSQAEEALAADLVLDGATAWSKLYDTISSQLTCKLELDGESRVLTLSALSRLRSHPVEGVRRLAYDAEIAGWDTVKEPLAAALNGIKGSAITLHRRRGKPDVLQAAIDASRLDRQTVDTMLAAMSDSFPMFRRYFKAKAKILGKERLAWWDLFVPVGKTATTFTWKQTREFILTHFASFTPQLEHLARRAFSDGWIDADIRAGKRSGAVCLHFPGAKESRISCHFDGTLGSVLTVAHELGHAFHHHCAHAAGKTVLQQDTPVALAETSSILCEAIVGQNVLKEVSGVEEELAILEGILNKAGQLVVDVFSAYRFEALVLERRSRAELAVDELCEIMSLAQKETYGEGLDERYRMKYMWARRRHFYHAAVSFYNFPYAFGLLFATGLYAGNRQQGAAFSSVYMNFLASTGEAHAADLAARFGIYLRSRAFWDDSLAVIRAQVDRYCALADTVSRPAT